MHSIYDYRTDVDLASLSDLELSAIQILSALENMRGSTESTRHVHFQVSSSVISNPAASASSKKRYRGTAASTRNHKLVRTRAAVQKTTLSRTRWSKEEVDLTGERLNRWLEQHGLTLDGLGSGAASLQAQRWEDIVQMLVHEPKLKRSKRGIEKWLTTNYGRPTISGRTN